ncbi:MAG: hypothetical protein IJP82_07485 [Bacteroidaceae bacterium]|nr:hypothetical protein [Bacteroidaceae bacterium]
MKYIVDKHESVETQYNKMPSGISGNLDARKIIDISKKFGINLGHIPNTEETKNTLLFLKTYRNSLAHGNTTFSNTGALVTFSDLQKYKKRTTDFLEYLINLYDDYVNQRLYSSPR